MSFVFSRVQAVHRQVTGFGADMRSDFSPEPKRDAPFERFLFALAGNCSGFIALSAVDIAREPRMARGLEWHDAVDGRKIRALQKRRDVAILPRTVSRGPSAGAAVVHGL